ncbi:hypothetical protein [Parvibaculum sp.]|uniref:hypothetical protein n=1 Tax=Parvibaculum sp. TaxID=2024848 RepID=UPI0025F24EC7|nr:hypothetical protein [Parvibaculum sp.]|tara:strand:+ start:9304 stop:9738 length:435 start_codon:yes stop_codon:yes gene_type:complete
MSDLGDTRIRVLRNDDHYERVEGSPGYWIEKLSGRRFHYTAFVVRPEHFSFPCPDCLAPCDVQRGDHRLSGSRELFQETWFRCDGCGNEAPLGAFRGSAYVRVEGEECATSLPSRSVTQLRHSEPHPEPAKARAPGKRSSKSVG